MSFPANFLILLPLLVLVVESSLPTLFNVLESGLPVHNIVKRKASAGELYVYADRKGCVDVTSRSTCPISWKLSPYFAKNYEAGTKAIDKFAAGLDSLSVGYHCKNSILNTLCSQVSPKCFEDGGNEFGNAKQTCERIYSDCPDVLANVYRKQGLCSQVIWTGMHPLGNCVNPTDLVMGVCPSPKYKMAPYFVKEYRLKSQSILRTVNNMKSSGLFSEKCLTKYKDMVCHAVYCSEDEKQLLTELDQEDCLAVVSSCFKELLSRLYEDEHRSVKQMADTLDATCKTYPRKTEAQRVTVPPTVSPLPVTVSPSPYVITTFYHPTTRDPTTPDLRTTGKHRGNRNAASKTKFKMPLMIIMMMLFVVTPFLVKLTFI